MQPLAAVPIQAVQAQRGGDGQDQRHEESLTVSRQPAGHGSALLDRHQGAANLGHVQVTVAGDVRLSLARIRSRIAATRRRCDRAASCRARVLAT